MALSGILLLDAPASASGSPPTVDAGPAKVLTFPAKDLTLFGHATDPENDPLTVQWTMTGGPASVTFSAPNVLTTTATFSTPGTYTFQLAVSDGTSNVTSSVTVTADPASSQTAFYVDPTYSGSVQNGSPSAPWTSLLDSDGDFTSKWDIITGALATSDVIIYFSARTAASDTSEQFVMPKGARLFVNRGCRSGTTNCRSGDTTGSHRLTLDGMSSYNTNDTTPSWVAYTGPSRFRLDCSNTCGSMSIGWDDDNQRDYVTIRGFEVTGPGARIRWGGSYSTLEYMWVHDVSAVGATVQFNSAVSDYPACRDFGKDHDITVRNNLIERGIGEGLYVAGTYLYTTYGGCPSYGNTHSDILIEGNTIRDPGINGDQGDGIDLKGGLINVTVRRNLIQNTHPMNQETDGVTAEGVFASARTNYLFEDNRIEHTWHGIIVGADNGTIIRNNVIANVAVTGIYSACDAAGGFPCANVEVYSNTVYASANGIGIGDTTGIVIRDNLLFGTGGGGMNIGGYNANGVDSDYNLMVPTGSAFAEGVHSLVLSNNAGLVLNAAGGDFHLLATSPAVDKGADLSATGFARDFDNVTRPQGAAWDIGAYEFTGAGGTGLCGPPFPGSAGCEVANAGQSTMIVKESRDNRRNRLSWTWGGQGPITKADFGMPTKATGYTLCLGDAAGNVLVDATAPAGGLCGRGPCWREVKTGFIYKDTQLSPDGVQSLTLQATALGSARLSLSGKGLNLRLPTLPLTTPITMRLLRSDGARCWEATFSSASRNDANLFKAVSN